MENNTRDNSQNKPSLVKLVAAFAAVYIIWGSTYLVIKYAIETLPTFLMAGSRFITAGTILYGIARFSNGYERPKPVHWRTAFFVGTLLLAIGNGGVVLAEHYISSNLAALLVATEPFWIVLLSWLFMNSHRPNAKVILGLLIGFAGVGLLISGQSASGGGSSQLFGVAVVIVATLGWAAGSLYSIRAPAVKSAIHAAGMQTLAGGVVLLIMGTVTGEWSKLDVSAISSTSILAVLYLVIFGAIVVFTAYSWLLKNASTTAVSTYAYVNPAIAVFLGWAIAGEKLNGKMLIGAAVIVGSVALITSQKKSAKSPEPES